MFLKNYIPISIFIIFLYRELTDNNLTEFPSIITNLPNLKVL